MSLQHQQQHQQQVSNSSSNNNNKNAFVYSFYYRADLLYIKGEDEMRIKFEMD